MGNIVSFLEGKKTYIVAILFALATFSVKMGYVDQKTYEMLTGLLTGAGLAALRAAVPDSK